MEQVLWLAAAQLVLVAVGLLVVRARRGRWAIPAALGVLGVGWLLCGGLAWGAWASSGMAEGQVLAAEDGRCRVEWMDPLSRDRHRDTVDCVTDGERAVGVDDTLILKTHRWPLVGRASSHVGPVTTVARWWLPTAGAALALLGSRLAARRAS